MTAAHEPESAETTAESETTAPSEATHPPRRRVRRVRSVTESLLSIVLGLEVAMVFFVALVLGGLRVLSPAQATFAGVGMAVLLIVVARLLRHRWGAWVGLALQLVFIAAGLLEPMMFLIGAGFAAMYVYFFAKGRQLDERNARYFAKLEESNAEGVQ